MKIRERERDFHSTITSPSPVAELPIALSLFYFEKNSTSKHQTPKKKTKKQPNGGVELIVGNHLLEGTFFDLKKPFAVLKKEGGRSGNGGSGGGGDGGEEGRREGHSNGGGGSGGGENNNGNNGSGSSSQSDNTRYKVVGVVRRKCLFKARPRALIARLT